MNLRILRDIKLGVKSLMLHKLRSTLTMLGVVFGVGSVVAMLSVGEGASAQAQDQIKKLGSNNIIITSIKPPEDQAAAAAGQRSRTSMYGVLYEDLDRLERYPAVRRAVPAKLKADMARIGQRAMEVRIVGTTPEWFELVPRELAAGRVLTERDMSESAAVCVVAEDTARALLAAGHTLNENIQIGGNSYTVVGIIRTESAGGSVQLPDRAIDVYIPINVFRQRIGDTITQRSSGSFMRETVELHQVIVEIGSTGDQGEGVEPLVSAVDNVQPTAEAIEAGLGRFHRRPDYTVSVPLALLRQARETQRIFNIVLGSIAGISLLVGGIGIMNIMLASVTERTREIGVRRAIGAKRRQIITQFLIETTALSLTGGLIGVGMGVIIPVLIENLADMPTVVTVWSVVLSLGISALVGIIFGIYPAYRAAMLDPIIALRHE